MSKIEPQSNRWKKAGLLFEMDSNDKTLMNGSGTRPTCVRYWVIVFAVTLSVITYIDRVCISQAAPDN